MAEKLSINRSGIFYTILFRGHIFIALMAVLDTIFFQKLYTGQLNYYYLAVVACGTLAIYNVHYLLAFFKPSSAFILYFFILTQFIFSLFIYYFSFLFARLGIDFFVLWSIITASMVYMMADFSALNVFKLPWIKPILLTIVWFGATAIMPAYEQQLSASHQALLLHYFLLLFAICVVFDNKDLAADRAKGIATISNKLGFDMTRRLGLILVLFSLFPLCLVLPPTFVLTFSTISLLAAVLIYKLRPDIHVIYYTMLLDGVLGLLGLSGFLLLEFGYLPPGIKFL